MAPGHWYALCDVLEWTQGIWTTRYVVYTEEATMFLTERWRGTCMLGVECIEKNLVHSHMKSVTH